MKRYQKDIFTIVRSYMQRQKIPRVGRRRFLILSRSHLLLTMQCPLSGEGTVPVCPVEIHVMDWVVDLEDFNKVAN